MLQVDRQRHREALGPPVARVAASQSIAPPFALKLLLELMVGLSLIVAAFALAPRRALPRPIHGAVGQREFLIFVAVGLDAVACLVLLVFILAVL